MGTLKPYLKWAGGKRQHLTEIKKSLPPGFEGLRYYEPFVGAGAVLFELKPKRAVINDFNSQLILTYNVIKEDAEELVSLLELHKKNHGKKYYYDIRNLDRDGEKFNAMGDLDKAGRLIYLNKTCFNGLYRVNSSGHFNVPFGRYRNPGICEAGLLHEVSHYLNTNDIIILNEDFEKAVSTADENSFVYFDPPYHSRNKSNFTGYQAGGFNEAEQERLCNCMAKLTERGVKCLLSNSDTEFIRKLYSGFHITQIKATRRINSDSCGRGEINELLIRNWSP